MAKSKKSAKVEPADRREKILDAAVAIFKKDGPLGIKFKTIAEEAGIDPPLMHYYFKNLDELHFEVIQRILAALKKAALQSSVPNEKKLTPLESLEYYTASYFDFAEQQPELVRFWIYFYSLACADERYQALNTAIRKEGRERIRTMLYQGIEAGEFKLHPGMKADEVALHIQGLISGNVIMAISEKGLLSWKEYQQATVRAVRTWVIER